MDSGFFYLGPPRSPEAFASNGRSVVALDMDRDGDVDLLVNNFRQPPVLLANTQHRPNHWLGVRLRGAKPNVNAIGARVTVAAGGRKVLHEVSCGIGYMAQDEEVLHFGLGAATTADVTVRWPNGKATTTAGVKADQIAEIKP
jgi:hypothetical protein